MITPRWGSKRARVLAQEPKDDEGRPYHVRLDRGDVGRVALLPGDPGRVAKIAERLTGAKDLGTNREYAAYGGKAGGEKVVVVSTGIGGPATAIAVEELARLGVKVMIRVGTCGAIQSSIKVGSLIIADAAVRMDGTSLQYVRAGYPAAATPGAIAHTSWASVATVTDTPAYDGPRPPLATAALTDRTTSDVPGPNSSDIVVRSPPSGVAAPETT